jgi:hypothetical protein
VSGISLAGENALHNAQAELAIFMLVHPFLGGCDCQKVAVKLAVAVKDVASDSSVGVLLLVDHNVVDCVQDHYKLFCCKCKQENSQNVKNPYFFTRISPKFAKL